ncbi:MULTISPECIES: dicarboxylate/amino acid:cation symporter [unclassified Clostridium]|uniref:dicarboxylate/amino acid:cation symporter n=1 Tax=unclassified Clostridium TaxID=2614128 RepID=UPI001C8C5EC4|nr:MULTISPECIES: dicarboxylate/amino acid:cation symporter [unclassified Clostridium]MBX9139159.1 dicarboxylate/amino acid:cation symporter [Clostridium sp. K12(2020)]MBX9144887.1 dicarboxylate/amino acid:cation symporter [Clostridium sp. K13]MDU2291363.1 dicarboxylate/amino acid:cation symporter [Clostridium celatum]MDU4326864.1 dicarboxylate/amino acid:cation symporter [Clostridium celatum]
MKFNFTKGKNKSTELAVRMGISLVLALIIGSAFILLRETLIANDKTSIWNAINNILFQDITADEGRNSLGIFYILGQLFINCLQLIIIPMVFSSIALAMCHISDTKKLGRISSKTLLGFLTTSVFALATACLFGFTAYKLGFFNINISSNVATSVTTASGNNPLIVILNAVPNNIANVMTNNSMVLSIVFLAVVIGLCINALGEKILVLKNLLIDINNIISVFLGFIITKFSPIAVFVLVTRTFAVYGLDRLKPALAYMLTVALASVIFLIIAYPLFVYLLTKLNPFIFMKKIAKVALLGFSAAASSAALSLNEKTTVEELGVDKDIASFVLPLGMTINMNGTAIMQVIAAIFIAASSGYSLTIQNVILIAVLALIASIGTPSAPGSSSIILFTVLTGMGFNNEATLIAYSLIIAINRPIDMLITCLNVIGDSATAVVVANSEGSLDKNIYNN